MSQNPIMANNSMNPSMIDQNTMNNLDPFGNNLSMGGLGGGPGLGGQPRAQIQGGNGGLAQQENRSPNIGNPNPSVGNKNTLKDSVKETDTPFFQMGDVVSNQRSLLFSNNDRYNKEEEIMQPLKSGGGLIGTTRIILEEKIQLLNLKKEKTLTNDQIFEKLRIDGVYVDDPQIYQKFTDINMQKLEERILREKPFFDSVEAKLMEPQGLKTQYFKMNGEIKLNNDLLADEITRPADLAFETSEAYQIKEVNSILSNRLHSFKKRYYRLDIVIGKISLLKYPQIFNEEDRMALEMKELYKEYERRTSLAMIPFYIDRHEFIKDQLYLKQKNPTTTNDELEFLQKNVEETQRKLDQEMREVQELALKVYGKWKQIKEIRKNRGFSSTNVKMKVHKQPVYGGGEGPGEFYFNLMHEEPSQKKYDSTSLPGSEITRRNNIQRVRAYVRLMINGKYVSRTKKAFLKWPNFEIEISEQFQVCLFTMPSSIQLEIVMGTFQEILVDVIDVEVPGKYVKALTSASSLVKEMTFSMVDFEKRKIAKKFKVDARRPPDSQLNEKQKLKIEEELKRKELNEKKAIENDAQGVLYLKAEWKGEGPEMPPMRSENIFKQQVALKARNQYNLDDQQRMLLRQLYIDVNDPRNEAIIRFIRETKNIFLIKLLQEDAKNPLSNLKPFRHMLLEARAKDPEMAKEIIPMLEEEIIQNPRLLDKLEVLFREQAYREYLEKKVEEERLKQGEPEGEKVYNLDLEDNAIKYDAECIRRRQQFFDKLKQYQREIKAGHQKASTQYKSVVKEFELLEAENPLIALFNKMFISGRKLKPVVQKRQPVALDSCKEAKIMIHVIKGFNVPIRNLAKQNILAHMRGGPASQFNQNFSQDPYGGSRNAPTAMALNQFGSMRPQSSLGQSGFQTQYMNNMNRTGNLNPPPRPNEFNRSQNAQGSVGTGENDLRKINEYSLKQIYSTARVETLVEVRIVYYEGKQEVRVTNVAEGDFPEWNEILSFPLESLNKKRFTRQELTNTKAMIYISLFDREVKVSGTGVMQIRPDYRYLGSVSIPLISLLNNPPKIEAVFKINRPLSLFNYQVVKDRFFFLQGEQANQNDDKSVPNTYISMSISLDPVLELPLDAEFEYYPGRETSALLIAASEWAKGIKKGKFEKRFIKCLGENISGQSVLLSRYILPQSPPKDIYDSSVEMKRTDASAIEKAARYVSLIPLIEDSQMFQDFPDLYCNSQEFIDLGAGDYEEHAIILCNYFNYIDQNQGRPHLKSYVMLGTGFPEGRTAYVLRRDTLTNHIELWNPIKGEAYFYGREEIKSMGCFSTSKSVEKNPNDAICQLRNIGCVIGQDNIWANVQQFDDPGLVDFNLENSQNWKSFFNKNNLKKYFPNERIISDQASNLIYMPPMKMERAHVIAQKIQNFLTKNFEEERIEKTKMRTKWNNQMEKTLTQILERIEITRQSQRQGASNSTLQDKERRQGDSGSVVRRNDNSEILQEDHIQSRIALESKGKKAWGFPINVTFTTLDMLWEEVKNTKIHEIYDDDAEFSISVHVAPYSHNVLSIWFYLLALVKQDQQY